MAADGLDTAFGSVGEEAWRSFVRAAAMKLNLQPETTVFEVGCGAGAFLYELDAMGCRVAGLDQSAALIDYARAAMPSGRFHVGDASTLDATDPADVVVSCGVLLYFPTLAYAESVIRQMAAKATRAVAIFDLPDAAKYDETMAARRGALGEQEYRERYDGLEHLFFDRGWIADVFAACGLDHVEIGDQAIHDYGNAAFRFNAYGFK
jgi:trans-aconitate methyltransferase